MSARHIQNTASQAKRTATALRNFAKQSDIERDDQALLRKSAQILEALASAKSRAAKIAKKAEIDRETFIIKATREATAALASWPRDTLIDQVALIRTHSHCAFTSLTRNDAGLSARRRIEYRLDDALRDIPQHLAYESHNRSLPIAALMRAARASFEQWRSAELIRQTALQLQADIDEADAINQPRAA